MRSLDEIKDYSYENVLAITFPFNVITCDRIFFISVDLVTVFPI